jgi:hypothetical protein
MITQIIALISWPIFIGIALFCIFIVLKKSEKI